MPLYPEQLEPLDHNNVTEALAKIEAYMHYICERTELNAKTVNKRLSDLEVKK